MKDSTLIKDLSAFGGAAFPFELELPSGGTYSSPGMTLRDYFAGRALPALLTRHRADVAWDDAAPLAYRVADAMLKARVK